MVKAEEYTFRPISALAVQVLARLAAKKAVQEQLRAEGAQVSLIPPREINAQAQVYLSQHPELIGQARELAQRLGLFERKRKWLEK
jgi:hypothetical protein